MNRTMTRQSARKFRLVAQATGGVVLVGSLGLAALVPTSIPQRAKPTIPGPVVPAGNQNTEKHARPFKFDSQAIADRLAMLDNAPKPDQAAVVENTSKDPGNTQAPIVAKTLTDRIKFLGTMSVGTKKMALISVDGRRQRVVSVGKPLPIDGQSVFLHEARDEAIFVRLDTGATLQINLAEAPDSPRISTLGKSSRSRSTGVSPFNTANTIDRLNPGNTPQQMAGMGSQAPLDPLERRRKALQRAVEDGTLSQEKADEMMDRALKISRKNARQNPSLRNRQEK